MPYQQQTRGEQLSEFSRTFPGAVLMTATAVVLMTFYFVPILQIFGVYSIISDRIGDVAYVPHFVTSCLMLSLYAITSDTIGGEDTDSDSDEDSDEVPPVVDLKTAFNAVKQTAKNIFELVVSLAYIWLLVSVAAVSSAYASMTVLPYFGVLIAVFLPIIEMRISRSSVWFLSPSTVLAFPAFIAVIPLTLTLTGMTIFVDSVVTLAKHTYNYITRFMNYLGNNVTYEQPDVGISVAMSSFTISITSYQSQSIKKLNSRSIFEQFKRILRSPFSGIWTLNHRNRR